ncbi:MAG: PAS domain S-box protein, partial [Gammaproteobacteria bacterium]|nr:PAS domain S-box protein [Gammaproteobacteria bacterium]
MQPIVYSLEFNCSKKNIFSFNSADPALLKRLGYEKDNLSIDLLGLDYQILSSFISHHSEMEPQIPVQTLYLVNHLKEKKAFCAFNASYETQRERSFLKLFLIDTGPFVKVEHQLSKNEEKYRELVENANSIILRWDRNGYITYFNEFAQSFFGYSEEEIIGQHVMDTIVPKTESTGRDLSPLMNDICEHPENYESNINENCTKDGHRIWINWTNKVLKDDDENIIGALSIGTDITRQRQMEEELRHQHKMDAIGQLAGGIAHDFNNMLHGLMGFAEILHSRLEDKKLKSFAEKIITIGKQSSELTGQLLAFSRKGQYQLVSIDLHHEVLELIMMLEHMLNKNISIESSMEAINPYIDGDQTQIKNSLLNLALNAKDAMPEGGTLSFKSSNVTLTKELMFQEKVNVAPGNYVRLDVCDTGCGMTNDTKDHA